MLMRAAWEQGLTLMELMVASTIAMVVAFGVWTMDVGRFRMNEELRERSGVATYQGQAALTAAMKLAKSLESADRINVVSTNPGDVKIRLFAPVADCGIGCIGGGNPDPCCFDNPANYRWEQYRLTGNDLQWYRDMGTCALRIIAREITGLTVVFQDAALAAPPGGEPMGGADNNLLQYTVTWDNGLPGPRNRTQTFTGQVTSRAIPYSDVNAAAGDSGWGLDAGGLNNPPGSCP